MNLKILCNDSSKINEKTFDFHWCLMKNIRKLSTTRPNSRRNMDSSGTAIACSAARKIAPFWEICAVNNSAKIVGKTNWKNVSEPTTPTRFLPASTMGAQSEFPPKSASIWPTGIQLFKNSLSTPYVGVMLRTISSWKFVRGSREFSAAVALPSTNCLMLFSVILAGVWFAPDAERRHTAWLNAMTWPIGRKSQKIQHSLFKCTTTKYVQTVRRRWNGGRGVTLSFVRANRSFVLFVGRNGYRTTQPTVTSPATSTRKSRLWNSSRRQNRSRGRNTSWRWKGWKAS